MDAINCHHHYYYYYQQQNYQCLHLHLIIFNPDKRDNALQFS